MFEYWSFFILTFVGFIGLGFLIYFLGNRKSRFEEMKFETYTCGEPFPKVRVSPENFYAAIKKGLGIRDMQRAHSGKLSDYLLWFLIGMVVVMLMVLWI
ncbi:MAG: hypothetical protein V3U72_03000 [Candidatus Aenigmarchaeota archaeon]